MSEPRVYVVKMALEDDYLNWWLGFGVLCRAT